jgi:hypothetical protein
LKLALDHAEQLERELAAANQRIGKAGRSVSLTKLSKLIAKARRDARKRATGERNEIRDKYDALKTEAESMFKEVERLELKINRLESMVSENEAFKLHCQQVVLEDRERWQQALGFNEAKVIVENNPEWKANQARLIRFEALKLRQSAATPTRACLPALNP